MSKIGKAAAKHFIEKKSFRRNNTEVLITEYPDGTTKARMWLYNSPIAVIDGEDRIYIDHHNYATATTRDRINMILKHINSPVYMRILEGMPYLCTYSNSLGGQRKELFLRRTRVDNIKLKKLSIEK